LWFLISQFADTTSWLSFVYTSTHFLVQKNRVRDVTLHMQVTHFLAHPLSFIKRGRCEKEQSTITAINTFGWSQVLFSLKFWGHHGGWCKDGTHTGSLQSLVPRKPARSHRAPVAECSARPCVLQSRTDRTIERLWRRRLEPSQLSLR
jgi:hypothetical protein